MPSWNVFCIHSSCKGVNEFSFRSDITVVCKAMEFGQFPLDKHKCYFMLTSCKFSKNFFLHARISFWLNWFFYLQLVTIQNTWSWVDAIVITGLQEYIGLQRSKKDNLISKSNLIWRETCGSQCLINLISRENQRTLPFNVDIKDLPPHKRVFVGSSSKFN